MRGGITNVFGNFEETKNAKQNAKIATPSIIHFRRTPAVVRKANSAPAVVRKANSAPAEGQYETNKLLLDLSQRISLGITKDRNGNKISPTVPPKYITYQMLYNECLDNRQTPPITKEEKEKLKMTFENDEKYHLLNNSIGVKILLNKSLYELERVKWWCDWYKMMKGRYSSGISPLSPLSGRVRSSSLRKAKTYGGVSGVSSVSGAGARRFSPSMTSRERRERQERQDEERIRRQYRLLIPIRNGLLYAMRCFGNVAYSAATFIYWTTSLIMDSNDIDVIHDTNEEVRQEYARRQAQSQEDLRRQRQEQYERTQRPPEYEKQAQFNEERERERERDERIADALRNAQRNVREKSRGERRQQDEKIKQTIFEKELNDLRKRAEQAEADQAEQEARQREIEIEYQEIMYIMREKFGNRRAFTQQNYDDAAEERRIRKQAGIRIPWDTAQSPPRAATRATQATQAAQAPSAIPQGLPSMNDDSNLGTLEEWKIISESGMRWSDIKGIQSIIGNNNNTIASVMLYLYLRNNLKDTDAISKLTKGHFGYQSIDALIADFKRHIFNNSYASIGEDFFKIKDAGSNVYSISRITLLRQRLNRVFFFLARDKKSESYVGYKRSRGDGYDFANSIGITDEDFVKIIKNPAAFAKDKTNPTKSVKLVTGKGKSTFDDFAPEDITVDVVIPTKLYDVHRRILLKSHPDKGGSAEQKKRADSMFENFLKWYRSYKPIDLNEKEVPFNNVVQIVEWDKYNNGEYSDIAIKWFLD